MNFRKQLPRQAIGVIAPSANVVVEWTAINLMRFFPNVGLHFARVAMRGAVDPHPDGYDTEAMLRAAQLLADAEPDVILWAGSKGALVSIEKDEALCSAIKAKTGVEATTPTIALRELSKPERRVALVTPYTAPYQKRLMEGLGQLGISCAAERHAGVSDNLAYAEIAPEQIVRMAREAVRDSSAKPDFVLTWCTNFPVASVVEEIERELDISVVDATLLGVKQALSFLGVDPSPARSWGRLFVPDR